ncbi:MAG TPA: hypothetical protein VML19_33665 [Verrucomicrobiae bacterium]|nr:hypothetical protein [Verrucomicrobiae bacterium]
MKDHLSPKEIARVVAVGAAAEGALHLRQCALCASEAARLRCALGNFREAVTAHALTYSRSPFQPPAKATRWTRWPLLVAAAAVVLLAAPVYQNVHSRHLAAQAAADAQLLDQVTFDVSEAAPRPMQGLEQLVVWTSTQPDNTSKGDVR